MHLSYILIVFCCAGSLIGQVSNVTLSDIADLSVSPPESVHSYESDSLQFGELRLPEGKEEIVPIIVLVHGGCWLSAYDLHLMDAMATDLVSRGYAIWNIEYRRVGDDGGGFPGTFNDIVLGINYLEKLAERYKLDLNRVIVMGHSAGGHLALWSVLPHEDIIEPLSIDIKGVVSLAGITDLAAYYEPEEGRCGSAVGALLDGSPESMPERYRQYSPKAFDDIPVKTILVQGESDPIVPHEMVKAFYEKFKDQDKIELVSIPETGHFDVIAPIARCWPQILDACRSLLSE